MLKRGMCMLLACLLALSMAACGGGGETEMETAAPVESMETTVPVAAAAPTTEPTTEPTTVPTEPPEYWRENVMMENPCWLPGGFDNNVLGSKIHRTKILTMTFLDTLDSMPEDAWDVSAEGNGSVMAWVVPSAEQDQMYDLYIGGEGGVRAPESCDSLFCHYQALREIRNMENFHVTSDVTSLHGVFAGCHALEAIDVSGWDTSSVLYMTWVFQGCNVIEELDLSNWDTSSVTDFMKAFQWCKNLKALDISTWDTSASTNFVSMFEDCFVLEELDVGGFDTSNVLYMHKTFKNCESLKKLDLSGWDTSKVEDIREFLQGCEGLEALDLGQWETDSVKQYTYFMDWTTEYNGESWRKLFEK